MMKLPVKYAVLNVTVGRFPNVGDDSYVELPAPTAKSLFNSRAEAKAHIKKVEREGKLFYQVVRWYANEIAKEPPGRYRPATVRKAQEDAQLLKLRKYVVVSVTYKEVK